MTQATLATVALVLAAAVVLGGCYAAACAARPFTGCRACQGTGYRTRRPIGTTRAPVQAQGTGRRPRAVRVRPLKMRPCRRCRGVGTRLRTGRRLYNYAHRIHRDATTTTMPPAADPKRSNRPHW